jgi:polyphosphate kinase
VAATRLHPDAPTAALLNRELSWLDLNGRVLELAADPNEPLLERVKFCSIFSSNLDEFFMVRVAGLIDQVVSGVSVRSRDGRTSQQTLDEIGASVLELSAQQSRLWLIEHIRAVATAAEEGKTARIRIKVNNLADADLVEELYRASQAGAQIDLIVRAVCTLVPGVEGLSKNIRVRSVLGRFLEHSRLFCFEAGEEKAYLLGSADLMPRNLDHRIEVVVPVEDVHVRNELEAIFKALLADNSRAWELQEDRAWERVKAKKSERKRQAQTLFIRRRERARRLARAH